MSKSFLIQNGLNEEDAILSLLFKFTSEYAIRKVYKNYVGLKLNGTHELLIYADVNLLRDNIVVGTTKKNTETLNDTSI
jgi:hypothetical protein